MKVYYSYDESGIEDEDIRIYKFIRALKVGFIKHMDSYKEDIEDENGFFIIRVDKDFNGGLEMFGFSEDLQNELIPYVDSFNNDGHIIRIYFEVFPNY